jgi:hypothetical protein
VYVPDLYLINTDLSEDARNALYITPLAGVIVTTPDGLAIAEDLSSTIFPHFDPEDEGLNLAHCLIKQQSLSPIGILGRFPYQLAYVDALGNKEILF